MEYIQKNHTNVIGYAAAGLASLIFWPLAYKTIKTQDVDSLSPYTIIIQLVASILWFYYGILQNDYPIILVQISILAANLIIAYCFHFLCC